MAGMRWVKAEYCLDEGISAIVSPLSTVWVRVLGPWNLGARLSAEHRLFARARHVDHRSLTGDDDRLRYGADFQVLAHVGDERAAQHDPLPLPRAESAQ